MYPDLYVVVEFLFFFLWSSCCVAQTKLLSNPRHQGSSCLLSRLSGTMDEHRWPSFCQGFNPWISSMVYIMKLKGILHFEDELCLIFLDLKKTMSQDPFCKNFGFLVMDCFSCLSLGHGCWHTWRSLTSKQNKRLLSIPGSCSLCVCRASEMSGILRIVLEIWILLCRPSDETPWPEAIWGGKGFI